MYIFPDATKILADENELYAFRIERGSKQRITHSVGLVISAIKKLNASRIITKAVQVLADLRRALIYHQAME